MGKLTVGTLLLWITTVMTCIAVSDPYMSSNYNWPLLCFAWVATLALLVSGVNDCVRNASDRDYEMRKLICEMTVLNSWVPPVGPCIASVVSLHIGLIAYPAWLVWSIAISWYYSTNYGKRSHRDG